MSRRDAQEVLFMHHGGEWIDPVNCGSAVSFVITVKAYPRRPAEGTPEKPGKLVHLEGSVRLTDCSRLITWDISDRASLDKLDKAINQLTLARAVLRTAVEIHEANGGKDGEY